MHVFFTASFEKSKMRILTRLPLFLSYGTDVYLHLNRLSSSSEPLQ